MRYDGIGDLIVSLPLIKSLKSLNQGVHIMVVASDSNCEIARAMPYIDEVVVKPKNIFKWTKVLLWLRSRRFDLSIDLNHSVAPHALLACRIINSRHSASPYKDGRWGVAGSDLKLFNIMPAPHKQGFSRPMSQIYLDIARVMNCNVVGENEYPLDVPNLFKDTTSRRIIVLNHTGSRPTMRIENSDLLQIARIIASEADEFQVVMQPIVEDYPEISALMSNEENVTIEPPSSTPLKLVRLIYQSSLVITPDTSHVHIGSAFSKPIIAIYKNEPTLLEQWRPITSATVKLIVSKDPKSLAGYSKNELYTGIREMVRLLKKNLDLEASEEL